MGRTQVSEISLPGRLSALPPGDGGMTALYSSYWDISVTTEITQCLIVSRAHIIYIANCEIQPKRFDFSSLAHPSCKPLSRGVFSWSQHQPADRCLTTITLGNKQWEFKFVCLFVVCIVFHVNYNSRLQVSAGCLKTGICFRCLSPFPPSVERLQRVSETSERNGGCDSPTCRNSTAPLPVCVHHFSVT